MVKSMYAGISGLKAHQQKMDVLGNNIANVNTWGYKSASYSFKDAVYQTVVGSSAGNTTTGGTGGLNSSQVGYGTGIGSITTSFSSGGLAPSDSPLDCMIDGTGFFIVGPMTGGAVDVNGGDLSSAGLSLTKVGIFKVDDNGYLVDNSGNYVYGAQGTVGADGTTTMSDQLTPIRIPMKPGVVPEEQYDIQSFTISKEGTLVGVDKDSNKPISIGQVALASVKNPNGLEKTDGYYYKIGNNAGAVTANLTNGGVLGSIMGGFLEMSNVDLAKEFSEMITTQRGFQANSKIITVTDEMLQELVNMKR